MFTNWIIKHTTCNDYMYIKGADRPMWTRVVDLVEDFCDICTMVFSAFIIIGFVVFGVLLVI